MHPSFAQTCESALPSVFLQRVQVLGEEQVASCQLCSSGEPFVTPQREQTMGELQVASCQLCSHSPQLARANRQSTNIIKEISFFISSPHRYCKDNIPIYIISYRHAIFKVYLIISTHKSLMNLPVCCPLLAPCQKIITAITKKSGIF